MKRILWILTVLAMLFGMVACAKSPAEEELAATDTVIEEDRQQQQTEEDLPEQVPQQEQKPQEQQPTVEEEEEKPTEPPKETPQETPEETPEEEPVQPEEGEIDYSDWIKVASYNIKCLIYGAQLQEVVTELKAIDADIVGFQEVDFNTTRSGQGNQMQMIAEAAGYPYWAFTKLIDFQGGEYGMGIVSRYPIKESTSETYVVLAEGDHTRKYGRHVLDVNGTELVFYNTHLTLGVDAVNGAELKQVTSKMVNDQYAVLTGDMNMVPDNMSRYVNTKKLAILNGDGDGAFKVNTFPAGKNPTSAIDNIIVTRTLDYYWNENTNVGIEVNHTDNSDHNLIWTYVKFK